MEMEVDGPSRQTSLWDLQGNDRGDRGCGSEDRRGMTGNMLHHVRRYHRCPQRVHLCHRHAFVVVVVVSGGLKRKPDPSDQPGRLSSVSSREQRDRQKRKDKSSSLRHNFHNCHRNLSLLRNPVFLRILKDIQ